jgi:hypothetical protein
MNFKQQVYRHCLALLEEQIAEVTRQEEALQLSLSQETKSTAGDKYETGRAMIHIEQEQLAGRLRQLQRQKSILLQINMTQSVYVKSGSLVQTDKGYFFISTALGCIQVEGQAVYVISAESPLGKQLLAKTVGQEARFGDRCYLIRSLS